MNPHDNHAGKGKDGSRQKACGLAVSSCIVAIAIFVLVNIVLWARLGTWTSPIAGAFVPGGKATGWERTFTWWISKEYLELKQAPDIVLMGSSQMGSATFASDAHRLQRVLDFVSDRQGASLSADLSRHLATTPTVFNWSMGGGMVSDAYMVSQAFFHGNLKPKVVVIGVAPRDFIDNTLTYAGMTEPFRMLSRFVDPGEELTAMALPEPFRRFEWAFERVFPLRRLKVEPPHEARVAGEAAAEAASAPQAKNQLLRGVSGGAGEVAPGQWLLPANMPYMFVDNTWEYVNRFRNPNPPIYSCEKAYFNAFLRSMRESGVKVLVVGMPSLEVNRKLLPADFWSMWRQTMAASCRDNDARWLDLTESPRFVMDDFLDTVHMNAYGGDKLFAIIAETLGAQPDMVATLDKKPASETQVAGKGAVPQ